jgi:pimeloyl-ACP methyl ester carboxylesterase
LPAYPQQYINEQLSHIKEISITKKENTEFKEYYEIWVEQPLDHFNAGNGSFRQRIIVGINNVAAPTIIETEGYALGKYTKPAFIPDCNVVALEHRYFGQSRPDSLIWEYLTIKQAAYDCHYVRQLFTSLFKGKWISSGISKGGQTAVAYKMYFPEDVDATIAYVTPIKNGQHDKRINRYVDSLANKECNGSVFAFQKFAFRNNQLLIPFEKYITQKQHTFSNLSHQKVLDYLLLEYPFAFFQSCRDCSIIPDTTALPEKIIEELTSTVSPRFFSDAFRPMLEPSFYMFYHELGYYEYEPSFITQMPGSTSYPNSIFSPQNIPIQFDSTYLTLLHAFIRSPATKRIVFIYGAHDPYTALQAPITDSSECLTFIVKNGCHKSRIADLEKHQQKELFDTISKWLDWPTGY